ncbi:helix-turn-helix domain-containing protein [Micromonospora sp. NPDC004704]
MILSVCHAPRHGARYAYGISRCDCLDAVEVRRERQRRQSARRPRVRGRAANRRGGWRGLDEIAVERAVGGDRSLVLTAEERRAAIDALDALGLNATEVAIRLGITTRTVTRQRARRRANQPAEGAAA